MHNSDGIAHSLNFYLAQTILKLFPRTSPKGEPAGLSRVTVYLHVAFSHDNIMP